MWCSGVAECGVVECGVGVVVVRWCAIVYVCGGVVGVVVILCALFCVRGVVWWSVMCSGMGWLTPQNVLLLIALFIRGVS